MHEIERMAAFVERASWELISEDARRALKIRLLDSVGCAIGALLGKPVRAVRAQVDAFGGSGHVTLVGGGKTAPDRACFYNGTLVRYLDFMDFYAAPKQTCHPSDTIAAVLAAAEDQGRSGRDLLVAMAVAYHIQSRLIDEAPVQAKGFDHTVQQAYAVAGGVSKALGLSREQTAHAMALSGVSQQGMIVTREGHLSQWKGVASAHHAAAALHCTYLASRGMTGPLGLIEGRLGLQEALSGRFEISWEKEDFERVLRSSVKRFNSEAHTQTLVEAALELRQEHRPRPYTIERVDVDVFKQAYNIVAPGGKEAGDKDDVHTKEQADHSIPYIVAVALLDGQVSPAQYLPDRIARADVQELLHRVHTQDVRRFTRAYPDKLPSRVRISLAGGKELVREKEDYLGFHTRPLPWDGAVIKFLALTEGLTERHHAERIVDCIDRIESYDVASLTALLANVGTERHAPCNSTSEGEHHEGDRIAEEAT
ncbi:MmgE/PrpD family protein [Pendulispora albinea]|uniref:MmgE/PrpD family protein n=1 Tax=Pendulispora albinea TaxID=2741071 RepID=A0ABZ2LSV9_9BACT